MQNLRISSGFAESSLHDFSDCLFDTSDVRLGEIWDEERANGQIHLSLPISHMSLYRIESFRIPQSKYTERFGV
jgi:hypothetical protein